jgi:large subunit ribosomal protein L18
MMKRRRKKKIFGTEDRPRLSIFRSNKEVYAQIINDETGHTLVAIDSRQQKGSLTEKSALSGKAFAKKNKEKKITKVTYDRGRYAYHGAVKAFFDAFRDEIASSN